MVVVPTKAVAATSVQQEEGIIRQLLLTHEDILCIAP